jgi:hypothetical protein
MSDEVFGAVASSDSLRESELPGVGLVAVGQLTSTMQIQVAREANDNATVQTILSGKYSIRRLDGKPWASAMDGFPEWWEKIGEGNRIAIGFLHNDHNLLSQVDLGNFLRGAKVVPAK